MTEIGKSILRIEDERLLRGLGQFTNDETSSSDAHLTIVRSPFASAKIKTIHLDEAKKTPGVLGIFSYSDLIKDGIGHFTTKFKFCRPDGSAMFVPKFGLLAKDSVQYVGDPIIIVVAKTKNQADDASELIDIEYDELPAVTDCKLAIDGKAPHVWKEVKDNIAFQFTKGDKHLTEQAFDSADHITTLKLSISRVTANTIEPRNAIGEYRSDTKSFILKTGTQTPHRLREIIATDILNVAKENVTVISSDIGGAFGMKNNPYPEYGLVLWAAKKLNCRVVWCASRTESMQSDCQGRDNNVSAQLATSTDGKFLGLKVVSIANLGAYIGPGTPHPPTANIGGMTGPYNIDSAFITIIGAHTHTPSTAPYRGAGRPEATYIIERLVDETARQLKIDRLTLRRKNMLTKNHLPFKTALGLEYDCGDFPQVLSTCIEASEWSSFNERKKISNHHKMLRGIGLAYSIEIAGGPIGAHLDETASLHVKQNGNIHAFVGTKEIGTGHKTAYQQILSDYFHIERSKIKIFDGDTRLLPGGTGSFGSRTMIAGSTAITVAARKIINKGRRLAAETLEAAEVDIEYKDTKFKIVGTDKSISFQHLAARYHEDLSVLTTNKSDGPTYPNGCHVCEVEIDSETGVLRLVRYTVVDDVGTVINPLIVKGQIHGGIAQGAGQSMMEKISFDETGQLITGSFLDYTMPRADNMPFFKVISSPAPTKLNILGVKGAGEAGTVGALPVIILAALDALKHLNITNIDMPLSSETLWRAIRSAKHYSGSQ
ncbi:MAG: carbon monoxide dehydrogenase [Rhodospirillaceae bacterium]|nr:carbon monoxide dehydrogenase [Rhodospirillaceae bacterium]